MMVLKGYTNHLTPNSRHEFSINVKDPYGRSIHNTDKFVSEPDKNVSAA